MLNVFPQIKFRMCMKWRRSVAIFIFFSFPKNERTEIENHKRKKIRMERGQRESMEMIFIRHDVADVWMLLTWTGHLKIEQFRNFQIEWTHKFDACTPKKTPTTESVIASENNGNPQYARWDFKSSKIHIQLTTLPRICAQFTKKSIYVSQKLAQNHIMKNSFMALSFWLVSWAIISFQRVSRGDSFLVCVNDISYLSTAFIWVTG